MERLGRILYLYSPVLTKITQGQIDDEWAVTRESETAISFQAQVSHSFIPTGNGSNCCLADWTSPQNYNWMEREVDQV